jgi:uncharacterized damage-inducible protein DinB
MLADQIRRYFAFNAWAWDRTFASVVRMEDHAYFAPRQLFEGSVHATLAPCLAAEYIWLERCNGRSPQALFDPQAFADCSAVQERWQGITAGWQMLLGDLTDESCAREVTYRNTRGEQFTLPLQDICQHVINHATEHRSQLTPILYHEGWPTEPLDYALYCLQTQS